MMPTASRAPIEHDLKCWPDPFEAMRTGRKPYEIRVSDRDYQVGDTLVLREWEPEPDWLDVTPPPGAYTGRVERRVVTYLTPGGAWGLPDNLCVLGLGRLETPKRRFELELHVSGDAWEDVTSTLRDLFPHIEEHGPCCDSVSGGPSRGHWVQVTERPEMTHEKYVSELDVYLDARSRNVGSPE